MTSLFPLLPVFLDLTGRAVVLLSAEAAFAPLARRLLDAGAGVTAIDPAPSGEMAALRPSVRILSRRWRSSDMAGATLVVAGADESRTGRARAATRGARALFASLGDLADPDVLLGSTVARGSLAIGVTAAGAAPGVGEAIARKFEAAVPEGYGRFLEAAARAHESVTQAMPDAAARNAFWRYVAEAAFEHRGANAIDDWDAWILARITKE
jgi:uroporphyrin-III C-methyltransferase / precorrin-2 dehydrogenase / sirohydrochlorin ferrochelatase